MTTTRGPIKLQIREDEDNNIITASLADLNDTEFVVISTISLRLCRDIPAIFEAWKEAMSQALKLVMEEFGIHVARLDEERPFESN